MKSDTKTVLKVVAATGLFAVVHTILASRKAKATATRLVGERNRNAFYRPFYNAQATVTSGALAYYIYKLPDKKLYQVNGPAAWAMQGLRLGFLVYGVAAAREIGFAGLTGWTGIKARLAGKPVVPPEPEAQGPSPAPDGRLNLGGPFRTSRHPLNFMGVPILWLSPTMTLKLAVFNTLATLYFWAGSLHEARRLRAAYGEAYRDYENSNVPFFLPGRKKQRRVQHHTEPLRTRSAATPVQG
ncbi:MAG: hypothetical protein JWM16_55 [Verrucomicrobiales bacterium]|nr:hypothetical protein [Verrucomicrobiales bacterium]